MIYAGRSDFQTISVVQYEEEISMFIDRFAQFNSRDEVRAATYGCDPICT